MVTPANCPQCGNPLPEGANACPNCGYRLSAEPTAPPTAGEPSQAPPPQASGGQAPASAAAVGASVNEAVDQTLERWNVSRSGILIAAALLAFIALLVGTLAHISYLTAGDSDLAQKFDAEVWFNLAHGAAIGAAALLLLVRWQSGPPAPVGASNPDLMVGWVLLGFVVFFCLGGLLKGLDDSFDAQDAWFSYARLFAFFLIGWFTISRPIPEVMGTTSTGMIGLILVGVSAVVLVIGQFMGLSENYSNYVTGVSFQELGIVGMLVAVGWFLGLRRRSEA